MMLGGVTLMGIVNVTPDSFSDGGKYHDVDAAVSHGIQLAKEGAHVLDIGGESTRPGADFVPAAEEIDRVIPVIEQLVKKTGVRLSIDTRKPDVAKAAVAAGAHIWNDVTALTYADDSLTTAAALSVPVILMHAQGDPKTMQENPQYDDVVDDVCDYLAVRRDAAVAAGIPEEDIILDPGIGFGKTLEHNIDLIRHLDQLVAVGQPVMLAASRKRFIAALDREGPAEERVGGSIAAVLAGYENGARWFRVHDVAATRQALNVYQSGIRHKK